MKLTKTCWKVVGVGFSTCFCTCFKVNSNLKDKIHSKKEIKSGYYLPRYHPESP